MFFAIHEAVAVTATHVFPVSTIPALTEAPYGSGHVKDSSFETRPVKPNAHDSVQLLTDGVHVGAAAHPAITESTQVLLTTVQTSGVGATRLLLESQTIVFCLVITPHCPVGHDGGDASVTTVGTQAEPAGVIGSTQVFMVSTHVPDHTGVLVAVAHDEVWASVIEPTSPAGQPIVLVCVSGTHGVAGVDTEVDGPGAVGAGAQVLLIVAQAPQTLVGQSAVPPVHEPVLV